MQWSNPCVFLLIVPLPWRGARSYNQTRQGDASPRYTSRGTSGSQQKRAMTIAKHSTSTFGEKTFFSIRFGYEKSLTWEVEVFTESTFVKTCLARLDD